MRMPPADTSLPACKLGQADGGPICLSMASAAGVLSRHLAMKRSRRSINTDIRVDCESPYRRRLSGAVCWAIFSSQHCGRLVIFQRPLLPLLLLLHHHAFSWLTGSVWLKCCLVQQCFSFPSSGSAAEYRCPPRTAVFACDSFSQAGRPAPS